MLERSGVDTLEHENEAIYSGQQYADTDVCQLWSHFTFLLSERRAFLSQVTSIRWPSDTGSSEHNRMKGRMYSRRMKTRFKGKGHKAGSKKNVLLAKFIEFNLYY